jgi:hypothetical protein
MHSSRHCWLVLRRSPGTERPTRYVRPARLAAVRKQNLLNLIKVRSNSCVAMLHCSAGPPPLLCSRTSPPTVDAAVAIPHGTDAVQGARDAGSVVGVEELSTAAALQQVALGGRQVLHCLLWGLDHAWRGSLRSSTWRGRQAKAGDVATCLPPGGPCAPTCSRLT